MTSLATEADAVADAFGLGAPSGPMTFAARGEQGLVWRLETSAGRFAVKAPLPGFEGRTDGVDGAFQEAVAAHTGLVYPIPLRRADGSLTAVVGDGHVVRVLPWMELLPPDRLLDPTQVGELLAALHLVEFPHEGHVDPWYWQPVGQPRWCELADLLGAAEAPFGADFRRLLPELIDVEALLVEPNESRMCHRDLWADNLRATPSGALCPIDWDNCGPADPSQELAMLLVEFGNGSVLRMAELYDAYRRAGGPGRVSEPEQLTMVLAQFGHFWELAARQWLAASTDEERHRAEQRVAELVTDHFGRAQVEAVVSCARRRDEECRGSGRTTTS